jgi:DNA-binding NtrC family response regulator
MKPVIVAVSRCGHLIDAMASKLTARGGSWFRSGPGERAVAAIKHHLPDLVIIDAGNDPDARVLAGVDRIKGQYPGIPLFLIARKSSEALAIGALKAGVDDYFRPPLSADDLLKSMDRRLSVRIGSVNPTGKKDGFSAKMVGRSRTMGDVKRLLDRVTMVDSTVLITGETGTGKELAAGLIHRNSARGRHAMVSVNCAALPDNLVESELFGYEQGALYRCGGHVPGAL